MTFRFLFPSCLGIKKLDGHLLYAVKLRGSNGIVFVPSGECVTKWPKETLAFLEQHVAFEMPYQQQALLSQINISDAEGPPDRVLACSDVTNEIQYMCIWQNGLSRKIISGSEHQDVVIHYLERKIDFDAVPQQSSIRGRSFRKVCILFNFF